MHMKQWRHWVPINLNQIACKNIDLPRLRCLLQVLDEPGYRFVLLIVNQTHLVPRDVRALLTNDLIFDAMISVLRRPHTQHVAAIFEPVVKALAPVATLRPLLILRHD